MSLLDALVLDSLLNPPVVLQEIWLANRSDAKGSGTQADPYWAPSVDAATTTEDLIFDQMMRIIVAGMPATGMTVRLQPGTYYTRGWRNGYGTTLGWKPASKLRIVGSGVGVTKLVLSGKLTSSTSLGTAAIGNDLASDFPDGIEISDLSIDCNSAAYASGGDQTLSGINMTGSNLFVRRVKVENFGQMGAGAALGCGICVAHARTGAEPYNCVIEACVARFPTIKTAQTLIGFLLTSDVTTGHHKLCVIRDCFADLTDNATTVHLADKYIGIAAGGGLGTTVANNQIQNAGYGISWYSSAGTQDLVIRGNAMTNVANGFADPTASSVGIDRIILLNNVVEWPLSGTTASPVGIKFDGSSGSSTTIFKEVIARGNIFKRPFGDTPLLVRSEIGLSFQNCTNVIAENNIADVGTSPNNALCYLICATVKAFNTRKPDGTFVPGYYITGATHIPEITTDVEDALLAI
jgi:hypothetical protein